LWPYASVLKYRSPSIHELCSYFNINNKFFYIGPLPRVCRYPGKMGESRNVKTKTWLRWSW